MRADGSDSPTLYDTTFDLPNGKGQFAALPYKAPGDAPDSEFPLVLVTGRVLHHYNAGTMTRRTSNLQLVDRDWSEIHPDDAARLTLVRNRSRFERFRSMMVVHEIGRAHV